MIFATCNEIPTCVAKAHLKGIAAATHVAP